MRRVADIYGLAIPEQPTMSPDGSAIVYVLRRADRDLDRQVRSLWCVDAGGGRSGTNRRRVPARPLTLGMCDTCPTYSPSGETVAFLRIDHDDVPQVWLLPMTGGEARQLTDLPSGAGAPVWSPTGQSIAFVADTTDDIAPDPAGPRAATPGAARAAAAPIVVDRFAYRVDGTDRLGPAHAQLHVLDVSSGSVRRIADGYHPHAAPAWSPDGSALAFVSPCGVDADLTGESAAYTVTTAAGDRPRRVGPVGGTALAARFTADGLSLLVTGRCDTAVGNARLLQIRLAAHHDQRGATHEGDSEATGRVVDRAAELDRNVMPGAPGYPGGPAQPTADGEAILFCIRDGGDTHVYRTPADGGWPTVLVGGTGSVVSGLSVGTRASRAAVVRATADTTGEIAIVDLATGALTELTAHSAIDPNDSPYPRVPRTFTAPDGTTVCGWVVRSSDTTGPAPLLVDIHGGPHNAWNGAADAAHLYQQELAARGWTILLVNPRGSDGYGESFLTAALGRWGVADADDITSAIDQLIADGLVDPQRVAVTGYSYGGYMTCYLTATTGRFSAAVAGGVVSDPAALYGTSDVGHELTSPEFCGTPSTAPEAYRQSSPLTHVASVTAPTLILHGAADQRCPVGQAEQWFAALRGQGVPTRMVLYPGQAHLFPLTGPPSHQVDYGRRLVDWVQRHVDGPAATRASARIDRHRWQQRLARLIGRYGVPGATLGILRTAAGTAPEQLMTCSAGVLNISTQVATTDDSVFQIGSMSKVWTTTLIMQLIDDGLISFDTPVREVLPDFRLAADGGDDDPGAAITIRHLLTHTSGIDGDVFTDTGRGDDCLERYVTALANERCTHPVGATFSYCNAGFVVAGRIVEVLTGQSWDDVLRARVIGPLGLDRTVTLPEEALRLRAAAGHVATDPADPETDFALTPVWNVPRSSGPAGIIVSDVDGVLEFARMHLTDGTARDGSQILAPQSVATMTERHVDLPDPYTLGDSWGLGWMRFGWGDHRLIGHDGNTIGQAAFLRVLPESGLAVTMLTNGGHAGDLYQELFREIFAELVDVAMPEPLRPVAEPARTSAMAAPVVGRYERTGERIDVMAAAGAGNGGWTYRRAPTGSMPGIDDEPTQDFELLPADLPSESRTTGPAPGSTDHAVDSVYLIRVPGAATHTPVTFYRTADGRRYLHSHGRATPYCA